MTYTYREIQNNSDLILIQTIDVVSLYNAFRKILLKLELDDKKLYYYLTFSLFKRNDTFVENTKPFAVALGYLLIGYTTHKNDKFAKIKSTLKKQNINNFENALKNEQISESLYQLAKEKFGFINLDGSAKDLVSLVNDYGLFSTQQILEIEKMTLILHPVNGCDLPS
ncbi:Uncharacterised protein [Mycoplasmopsis citelli]|uniref:Uncharacterized protein n=1 Tax=Mycoplasmopsis citelli TaxID=171281 RepID=A0A449B2D4_9BACT|nr:hypothetical protein [Mycoplasmopsis citelli]VEU74769.1 Uncharacterised protein [Mycoplasmopsis citelli]